MPDTATSSHRYATRAINAVVVLQLRNYVDDSQHGTFRALGVVRMGMGGREGGRREDECSSQQTSDGAVRVRIELQKPRFMLSIIDDTTCITVCIVLGYSVNLTQNSVDLSW